MRPKNTEYRQINTNDTDISVFYLKWIICWLRGYSISKCIEYATHWLLKFWIYFFKFKPSLAAFIYLLQATVPSFIMSISWHNRYDYDTFYKGQQLTSYKKKSWRQSWNSVWTVKSLYYYIVRSRGADISLKYFFNSKFVYLLPLERTLTGVTRVAFTNVVIAIVETHLKTRIGHTQIHLSKCTTAAPDSSHVLTDIGVSQW